MIIQKNTKVIINEIKEVSGKIAVVLKVIL
jgi:hypothetical protein